MAAEPQLRTDAAELGAVYRQLHELGHLPLGTWAVPPSPGPAPLEDRLLYGISGVHGAAWQPYMDRYRDAYWSVMPRLRAAALVAARRILNGERVALIKLRGRLAAPGVADRLHELAGRVGRRAGGYGISRGDVEQTNAEKGPLDASWQASRQYEYKVALDQATRRRVGVALRAEVAEYTAERPALDMREEIAAGNRQEIAELVLVLFAHPRGVAILAAYDRSPVAGAELAAQLLGEAMAAMLEFGSDLENSPEDVWRYAPLVLAGVQQLGLGDVDAFPEYAVDAGQVLGRSTAETVVGALGMVLFCVALVFTGPVGAVVIGTLDLALTGAGGVLAYLREREQDLAATASSFRAEDQRLTAPSDYGDTAMAGVAALVSALSLVQAVGKLAKLKARAPGTVPPGRSVPLDPQDRAAGFYPNRRLETALEHSGDRAALTRAEMAENARGTNRTQRIGRPEQDALSPQQAAARTKKLGADAAGLGPGAPRELAPEAIDGSRGVAGRIGPADPPPPYDPLGFNPVPLEDLQRETTAAVQATGPAGRGAGPSADLDEAAMTARQRGVGTPDLAKVPRANDPGRLPGRVITHEEQLYGINLEWDKTIRRQTPSPELQEWARGQLSPGDVDPVIPTLKVDAASADHIVPVELARQLPGFAQLDVATQVRILNSPENIMAVSRRVNEARGSIPFSRWNGLPGHPIPPEIATVLKARETAVASLLQQRIDDALRAQQQARGLIPPVGPALPRLPAPGSLLGGATGVHGPDQPDPKQTNELSGAADDAAASADASGTPAATAR